MSRRRWAPPGHTPSSVRIQETEHFRLFFESVKMVKRYRGDDNRCRRKHNKNGAGSLPSRLCNLILSHTVILPRDRERPPRLRIFDLLICRRASNCWRADQEIPKYHYSPSQTELTAEAWLYWAYNQQRGSATSDWVVSRCWPALPNYPILW